MEDGASLKGKGRTRYELYVKKIYIFTGIPIIMDKFNERTNPPTLLEFAL